MNLGPQVPAASPDAMAGANNLLALIADPKGYQEKLAAFSAAQQAAQEAVAIAEKERAEADSFIALVTDREQAVKAREDHVADAERALREGNVRLATDRAGFAQEVTVKRQSIVAERAKAEAETEEARAALKFDVAKANAIFAEREAALTAREKAVKDEIAAREAVVAEREEKATAALACANALARDAEAARARSEAMIARLRDAVN